MTVAFLLINFCVVYWGIMDIVFAIPLPALAQEALISTLLYKLAVIMVSLTAMYVFQLQGIILKRSAKRLLQIHTLIPANFLEPVAAST